MHEHTHELSEIDTTRGVYGEDGVGVRLRCPALTDEPHELPPCGENNQYAVFFLLCGGVCGSGWCE